MGAVMIEAMSSRSDHAERVYQETVQKFSKLKGADTVLAAAGDRLVAMSLGGDQDVLEVLLPRRSGIVARSLTGMHFEAGKKYMLPVSYNGKFPPMHGAFQLQLFQRAADDKPVKPKRSAPVRSASGETKLDVCKRLYAAALDKQKAAIVSLFIEQGGCTEKGAVTYYYVCKKDGV